MSPTYFLKQLIATLILFAIIFISAGRINYLPGIVYAITGLIMFLLGQTVFRIGNDLIQERSKPGEGTKKWDKLILGFSFLMTLSMYVVAGLDSGRFHWSPEFHKGLFYTGIILTASGQLIFLIAQKQNKFFSSTVRIQTDREHTVCDTGLYKVVRHPAYMGSVIQAIGFPLLFGSYWSIIPIGILIILFLVRTGLEDKTLKDGLNGYQEYSAKTRYRIIPFLW